VGFGTLGGGAAGERVMGGPDLLAAAAHPAVLTVTHYPMLLGRPLGSGLVLLGALAGAAGWTVRCRSLQAAALVAVVAGSLTMTQPESLELLGLDLAALLGTVGALAARAAVWSTDTPPGDPAAIEQLRLLHGHTHISCFAGNDYKSCLTSPAGAVPYKVRWGVAVAAGDPLATGEQQASAARAFLQLCARRRWVPCFFQTDAALRPLYRGLGLRLIKFGEEAVVDVSSWDLASPARADARHDVARARRAGLKAAILRRPQAGDPFWAEAAALSAGWLRHRGGREMGFSLGRLGEAVDSETWYTLARDGTGRLHAFCSWVRFGDRGIALDLVRRRDDSGPGAVDLCITAALEAARAAGLRRVSLGTVPFRESRRDAPDGGLTGRLRALLYRRGWGGYSYRGLSHFKSKFATSWESRDLALPRGPAGVLALAALVRLHLGGPYPGAPPPRRRLELAGLGWS
jgi:phosphatidylglycerol lysyltransferase